jgi:hypothetical protein
MLIIFWQTERAGKAAIGKARQPMQPKKRMEI